MPITKDPQLTKLRNSYYQALQILSHKENKRPESKGLDIVRIDTNVTMQGASFTQPPQPNLCGRWHEKAYSNPVSAHDLKLRLTRLLEISGNKSTTRICESTKDSSAEACIFKIEI